MLVYAHTPTVQRHLVVQKQHCVKVNSETYGSDISIQPDKLGWRLLLQGAHQRWRMGICACACETVAPKLLIRLWRAAFKNQTQKSLCFGTATSVIPQIRIVWSSQKLVPLSNDVTQFTDICFTGIGFFWILFCYGSTSQLWRQTQSNQLSCAKKGNLAGEHRFTGKKKGNKRTFLQLLQIFA